MSVRSLSFPKSRRLTCASEFARVKQKGYAKRGKLMTLGVLAVQNAGSSRVGFVTTRSVGSATVRNRLRRRLLEIVRDHQHDLRHEFWIVLVASLDVANASYCAFDDEW